MGVSVYLLMLYGSDNRSAGNIKKGLKSTGTLKSIQLEFYSCCRNMDLISVLLLTKKSFIPGQFKLI